MVEKLYRILGFDIQHYYRNVYNCPACMSNSKEETEAATPRGVVDVYKCLHCGHHFEKVTWHRRWAKEID